MSASHTIGLGVSSIELDRIRHAAERSGLPSVSLWICRQIAMAMERGDIAEQVALDAMNRPRERGSNGTRDQRRTSTVVPDALYQALTNFCAFKHCTTHGFVRALITRMAPPIVVDLPGEEVEVVGSREVEALFSTYSTVWDSHDAAFEMAAKVRPKVVVAANLGPAKVTYGALSEGTRNQLHTLSGWLTLPVESIWRACVARANAKAGR